MIIDPTTFDEAEYRVLTLMSVDHKFAIGVAFPLPTDQAQALDRLQMCDWVRLIDVGPIAVDPGRIYRIFRVMPYALKWYEQRRAAMN